MSCSSPRKTGFYEAPMCRPWHRAAGNATPRAAGTARLARDRAPDFLAESGRGRRVEVTTPNRALGHLPEEHDQGADRLGGSVLGCEPQSPPGARAFGVR